MTKLTKAQIACLQKAAKPGGVVGFGKRYTVTWPLRKLGLLTPNTEHYGYLVLTTAGRLALAEQEADNADRS